MVSPFRCEHAELIVRIDLQRLRSAFTDLTWEPAGQVVEGDSFVVRFEQSGLHTGPGNHPDEYLGLAPAT
jgi:hypothetical protein